MEKSNIINIGDYVSIAGYEENTYGKVESFTPKRTKARIVFLPERERAKVAYNLLSGVDLNEQQQYALENVLELSRSINLRGCELGSSQTDIVRSNIHRAAKKIMDKIITYKKPKTDYWVKRYEEEMGDEIMKVTVPESEKQEQVMENLKKASTFAQCCFWEDISEDYDEHFNEMADLRENVCGDVAFSHYLEHFCGYKVTPLFSGQDIVLHCAFPEVDFSFEW